MFLPSYTIDSSKVPCLECLFSDSKTINFSYTISGWNNAPSQNVFKNLMKRLMMPLSLLLLSTIAHLYIPTYMHCTLEILNALSHSLQIPIINISVLEIKHSSKNRDSDLLGLEWRNDIYSFLPPPPPRSQSYPGYPNSVHQPGFCCTNTDFPEETWFLVPYLCFLCLKIFAMSVNLKTPVFPHSLMKYLLLWELP